MTYTVSTAAPPKITLCEDSEITSVLQNIYIILTTRKNTVPMYRDFGIPMAFVDKPLAVAETILASEVRQAIADYEPRAKFIDVSFSPSDGGAKLTVKVEVGV